ncbi:2-hydroxy-3-oxopropionate reductase [Atopostipes suicloacalis DSM 15692]|uniref:2-hydroxy-3-oxopropionate reductase n=1 Tax=Atopostipes suicloacalis DSM 15692 TaxID=1121025 RepID=A0A1M4YBS7_9LACT|nr:2-hydroxy-3-oxopropionate reductase [Atopostipes suicloacalis]SHF03185.1 2-hydroxy-3-oxopropionate reductase [Atopostipes suicloacalis DSM 15692]
MKIGFVGLGIMGKPMAINLVKAGHEVYGYDFVKESIDDLVEAGGHAASSGKEAAEKSELVIIMLPNSPHVESALFTKDGIAEGLSEGMTVIDMSSISPVASVEFSEKLNELGVSFLDAPVSGGEPGAIEGSIAVMVGGDQDVFDKYYDVLMVMASSVTLVGEVGAGNTTKLANQMIVAINIAGISEAYSLAKKAGVDPENVYKAIRSGLAGSKVMEQKSQKIFDGDFDPGFRIELHIKDLQNALDSAHEYNAASPFTALSMEIMQSLRSHDLDKKDHSAIARYYEMINNQTLQ